MSEKGMIGNVEVIAVIDMIPPAREPSAMFPDVPHRLGMLIRIL